ncbi:MAG: hypothetical protein ACXAC7_09415 [Candidatus Hodarchaeales archaeon]|jgi:hypothetical protein
MNWRNPFYVCEICGVSYRKHELERARENERTKRWGEQFEEDDPKKKRNRDYERWYLKQNE